MLVFVTAYCKVNQCDILAPMLVPEELIQVTHLTTSWVAAREIFSSQKWPQMNGGEIKGPVDF